MAMKRHTGTQNCTTTIGNALPLDYQPAPHTVIVGKGKEPQQNLGNQRLRALAASVLNKYQQGDKKSKTRIVSDIIARLRNAAEGGKGAFVKYSKSNGRWYDLGDNVARDKVGYVFRDLLADEYRSSSKSKVARRHKSEELQEQARSTLRVIGMAYSDLQEHGTFSDNQPRSNSSYSSKSDSEYSSVESIEGLQEAINRLKKSVGGFNAPETQFWPVLFPDSAKKENLPSAAHLTAILNDEDVVFDYYDSLMRLPLMEESPKKEANDSVLRLPALDDISDALFQQT